MAGRTISGPRWLPRLPTRRDDWRLMGRTARLVLGGPGYAVLALVTGVLALSLFVFSLNLPLVGFALSPGLPLADRLTLLVELYPFVGPAFGVVQGLLLLVVAALVGVDVSMAVYHVREHDLSAASGSGLVGVILGTLGAGCAACGSAVLAGLLSLLGIGSLTILPLDGLEFAILGLVAVLLSIFWLADGMRGGEIRGCPVDL
ncbi:hypothetical protein [Haloglomus litoreum]|uniref:hypothetical protein n=1 Tax=Haloglomus litoreum TaxID=3034026 RepID=UPI0023E7751F|nr:hypothetical protein [Haloglomus sp. DT116]